MRIGDLRKFLEKFDSNMDVKIKGFPPNMDAIELRYDISSDVIFVIPAHTSESVFIKASSLTDHTE